MREKGVARVGALLAIVFTNNDTRTLATSPLITNATHAGGEKTMYRSNGNE
jgi:hypothetical protein